MLKYKTKLNRIKVYVKGIISFKRILRKNTNVLSGKLST